MAEKLNREILSDMKKGQKLFVVDLESVSLYSDEQMKNLLSDEEKYKKTPFLFLIASYMRNKSLDWAARNLLYQGKIKTGSWMVYSFVKT